MPQGDPRKLVSTYDPVKIGAFEHNRQIRAATRIETETNGNSADGHRIGTPEGLVYIQNNSGADRNRFDILGITSALITPAQNLVQFQGVFAFKGGIPSTGQQFVVCYEPISAGNIGRAFIFGVCPVRTASLAMVGSTLNLISGNASELAAGAGSAQVLYAGADSESINWAVVALGSGGSGNTPVSLQVNGGANGTAGSAPATYTYDAYSLGAIKIASMVPVAARTFLGPVYQATTGILVYNWNGQVGAFSATTGGPYLIITNESPVICG